MMKFTEIDIPGVFVIEPKVFGDSRGYFAETFKQSAFEEHIGKTNFIQDNESMSSYGVLRGLHFQRGDFAQAKLVRAIKGAVLDVVVDIRSNSSSFGKYFAIELNETNKLQLFVPRGFAHGFLVLSEQAIFSYKVDNVYSPENESGIIFNDPSLAIDWRIPLADIKLSEKDKGLRFLSLV